MFAVKIVFRQCGVLFRQFESIINFCDFDPCQPLPTVLCNRQTPPLDEVARLTS